MYTCVRLDTFNVFLIFFILFLFLFDLTKLFQIYKLKVPKEALRYNVDTGVIHGRIAMATCPFTRYVF